MIAELYKIRYMLLVELSLLILFGIYGFTSFLVLLSFILLLMMLSLAFSFPVVAVHFLIFSILVDSLIPIKNYSGGPSILFAEFFLVVLSGVAFIRFLLNAEKRSDIPLLMMIWIPFLLWILATGLLIGVDKFRVVSYWKNYYAGFFAFSLTYYAIKSKFHLKSLIAGIIIWGLILSLFEIKVLFDLGGFAIGIVGLFLKKNLLTLGWGRSNYLAAFFVVIIPISIGYLIYTKSKKLKIFITTAIILMSFAMILTLSRGGILALLIALLILFSRVLKARTFVPFLLVFLLISIVILVNPLTYVLIERISSFETSGSYFSRIDLYKEVWGIFLQHPITGVGLGNLGYHGTFVLPPDASPAAHNIILGALGETGIIGALFYITLIGTLLVNIYSRFKIENEDALKIFRWCFISSIAGGLLHALVEPTLDGLQFSIIFWTLAGISAKLYLLKTSNE